MDIIKKHLKLYIGIAVLILVAVVFFFLTKSADLENGNMKHWSAASNERRVSAVRILTGSEENTELMVQCLNKVAKLPDATDMPIKDAASLCYTGIQLKENI